LFAGDFFMNIEIREIGEEWTIENGLHFTMIFNTFVYMNIFNEINARKIGPNGKSFLTDTIRIQCV
jgi:hypothetical protein